MQKSKNALITLKNAGYQKDDRWLVRGVDLTIQPKEIVTLIGPNGSGKSTTAKVALGLLKPSEGSAERSTELTVSYVPQKIGIDWTLPLNVQRFMTLTSQLTDQALDHALSACSVSHLAKSEVRHLSGGEFQRVLLARAIARKPNLLVLDEPVQGVDFPGEIELYNLIKDIRDELKCGILLISHDLHIVMAATDQVICLNGHVCCSGSPSSVASSPEYTALFGSRADPALAIYQHHHDHTHLPDGNVQHADGSITKHCHPEDGHHDHEHPKKDNETQSTRTKGDKHA